MAIQHRDSAILSTSGKIASAVHALGQLHCEARGLYRARRRAALRGREQGRGGAGAKGGAAPKEPSRRPHPDTFCKSASRFTIARPGGLGLCD